MYLPAMLLLLAAPSLAASTDTLSAYTGNWLLDTSKSTNVPQGMSSNVSIGLDKKHLSLLYLDEGRKPADPELYRVDGKESKREQIHGIIVTAFTRRLSIVDGGATLELMQRVEFGCRSPGPGTCSSNTPAKVSTTRVELVDGGRGLRVSAGQATLLYARAPSP